MPSAAPNRPPTPSSATEEPTETGLDSTGLNESSSAPGSASDVPCTPNETWCEGNVLRRCARNGQSITDTPCDICGDIGGIDGCIDRVCEPSTTFCDGPTRMICDEQGLSVAVNACPDGNLCSGNGECTPVQCDDAALRSTNDGGITVYWFDQGTQETFGDVACGFGINPGTGEGYGDSVNGIANPEFFGAMNTADYRTASSCGACVNLRYQGREVTITIVDECPLMGNVQNPTCTAGHIDLSRAAWNELTGNAPGNDFNGVSWNFVPCETTGPVAFELQKADDPYWNEVLVRNHRYEIQRLEIEMEPGRWVDAVRQNYNYWRSPEGDPDGAMGTYRVRAWDVNGGATEAQLELRAGAQLGSSQFACE